MTTTQTRLRTLASMAKTGLQNPGKIPPWLHENLTTPLTATRCSLATRRHLTGTPKQTRLLNDLRQTDSYALIILDACRYDYFTKVFADDFPDRVRRVASGGRDTFEYLQVCWPNHYQVPYVSAAVPVNSSPVDFDETGVHHLYNGYQPTQHLENIDDIWKQAWDTSLGACPPEPITQRAQHHIHAGTDSLVVHYQQPHTPYIGAERELGEHDNPAAYPGRISPIDKPIWDRIHAGDITDERLHELYRSNIKRVRPAVLALLEAALDGFDRVVVTADHGEALGEYGVYAHPRTPHHPKVRAVPWVEVTELTPAGRDAASLNANSGSVELETAADQSLEERLRGLGYQ